MNIFIHKDGQQHGPYSLDEVNAKARTGEFLSSVPAWIEGWAEWQPLSGLPGFASRAVPPPFKPRRVQAPRPSPSSPPEFSQVGQTPKMDNAPRGVSRCSVATIGTYVAGLLLLVLGFLSQEGANAYHVTHGISAEVAGMIGGACPVLIGLMGFWGWRRWCRGHRGSVIVVVGLIAAAKGLGALVARLMIMFYIGQAHPKPAPQIVVDPRPASPQASPTTLTADDQEFERQRAKSKAEAIALYPDLADGKTALGKEVARVIESYKATDNPDLYAPNAPMLIALTAAKNLRANDFSQGGRPFGN